MKVLNEKELQSVGGGDFLGMDFSKGFSLDANTKAFISGFFGLLSNYFKN